MGSGGRLPWCLSRETLRRGGDPDIAQVNAGIYHGPDESVPEYVGLVAMVTLIGLAGVALGALAGGIVTFLTTRSSMRLELEFSYDKALRDKRLERYQALFSLSRLIPRYWPSGEVLTPEAKELYLQLQNSLWTISGLRLDASQAGLASELRHQLAEDVGASHRPRLRWTIVRLAPGLVAPATDPTERSEPGAACPDDCLVRARGRGCGR